MFEVIISAGSNLGDRKSNLDRSIRIISGKCTVQLVSSVYETEPVGKSDQPYFYNMVYKIRTRMLPHCLLEFLKETERSIGRTGTERWGPRIIDLDIIFFSKLIVETPNLKIPHPDAHRRRFVLEPLEELCPDMVHPLLNKDIKSIIQQLECRKKIRKIS